MLTFPNAKVNLGLRILRKRPDGFHEIDSCFYPVGWKDALEILPSQGFSFNSSGIPIDSHAGDNLCEKAYSLLAADFGLSPISMHLHKNIPIGAGLGGGSADAAFALSMLNELFGLELGQQQLEAYAAQLGSDCPFFVANKPVLVGGRGEALHPTSLSLKGWYIVLAYPDIHISTKEAYQGVRPKLPPQSCQEVLARPVEQWEGSLVNDFEASLFAKYPELPKLKEGFYQKGAIYASMTGSGSTVFGLFKEKPQWEGWGWKGQLQGAEL